MTTEQLLKQAIKSAKAKAGMGWSLLGADLQEMLVRAEALSLVASLASFEDSAGGKLAQAAMQYSAVGDPSHASEQRTVA